MSPFAALVVSLALAAPRGSDAARRTEAAFAAGDYEAAAAAAAEARVATGDPKYYYAQAQAERFGGHCELAIEHYRQFIAEVPSGDATLAAQDNIAECEALLGRTSDVPEPLDPLGPVEPSDASQQTDPSQQADASPQTDPTGSRRAHWARDPLGGILVGTGAAALGIGGAFYGSARANERAAKQADDVITYGQQIDRAYRWSRVGVSMMIGGGALVVGGVIRWIVVSRRSRSPGLALRPSPGSLTLRF